jgi:hypothetical protein
MFRPTRLAATILAAVAFAAATGPAASAAGPDQCADQAGSAQADHKPAGTGSGRKIG